MISQFSELESLLSECLNFIPFIEINQKVVSPKFTPIIVECCGLIESIFKEYAGIENKQDMKSYSKEIDSYLLLEDSHSIFLYPPLSFLNPFKDWTKKAPDWWYAYNKLKHDRLNNYNVATYETAIQAMAGLHQVISRNTDFVPMLLSAGWFNSNSQEVGELVAATSQSNGISSGLIPVESKLFVSPFSGNFITYKDNEPYIEECDFTNRVRDMMLVYEWY